MTKLFLLKPNFTDDKINKAGQQYYCPSCAAIEGVLAYYPFLREKVEVIYVDFAKPRPQIVSLLGAENQGCPVLVLNDEKASESGNGHIQVDGNKAFINSTEGIMQYLADVYKIALPHP